MLKTNMNHGKNICRQLKQLRRDIADANGIELHQKECTYQGECEGTCPYCDAELRYLERELDRRRNIGKAAVVAGALLTVASMQTVNAQEQIMGKPAISHENVVSKGTLKGIVHAENTGEPIIGCKVVVRKDEKIVDTALTDIDGIYTIKGISKGVYSIEMSHPEYFTSIMKDVSVKADGFTVVNCVLEILREDQIRGLARVKIVQDTNRTPTVIIKGNEDGEDLSQYFIGGVEVQLNGTPASAPAEPSSHDFPPCYISEPLPHGTPASVPAEPSPVGRKVDDDNTNPLDNCVR